MEIAYSQFERSLELPCDLKRADIATELSRRHAARSHPGRRSEP